MSIEYVARRDLDTSLWDQAVSAPANGFIYARSSYLDLLADNWDALVIDNYKMVMPLPFRIKWGIRYLYQPAFIQQLGVIGINSNDETERCIAKAKEYFRYAAINLNFDNKIMATQACSNFILDLTKTYSELTGSYNYYLRKTTRETKTSELLYKPSVAFETSIDLYRRSYGNRFPHVKERSYKGILQFAEHNPSMVICREAWYRNELVSSLLLLKDIRRLYLLISVNTEKGQTMEANRFLMDQLIREFSSSGMILDFEGSDLPGVAAFYTGFGAVNQPYYSIHWNNLPWPLNKLKK
jgi:hypothetical protein